jgi:hypothetical protein
MVADLSHTHHTPKYTHYLEVSTASSSMIRDDDDDGFL